MAWPQRECIDWLIELLDLHFRLPMGCAVSMANRFKGTCGLDMWKYTEEDWRVIEEGSRWESYAKGMAPEVFEYMKEMYRRRQNELESLTLFHIPHLDALVEGQEPKKEKKKSKYKLFLTFGDGISMGLRRRESASRDDCHTTP